MKTINREQLKEGARAFNLELTAGQLDQFERYAQIMDETNQQMNLTRVPFEEFVTRHFLDSLSIALCHSFPSGTTVLDVGTGAGLPGVALQIAFPTCQVTLLEATAKLARFLEGLKGSLELPQMQVLNGRAEELAHEERWREKFDLVTARAVAAMPALVEITMPFAKVGGKLVAMKSEDATEEIKSASRQLEKMGGKLSRIEEVHLPGSEVTRLLPVIEKTMFTPVRFPRSWKLIKESTQINPKA